MKAALLILVVAISSTACRKTTDLNPKEQEVEVTDTLPILKYSGTFTSDAYGKVIGEAKIYKQQGKYFLTLDNFKSSSGANLHLFLSKEKIPGEVFSYDLGHLKSTSEIQKYLIDENLDKMQYGYVSLFCVDTRHLFGWIKL